jgi:ribosome biogenesis GTPase
VFAGDRSWRCAVRARLYDEGKSPLVGDRVTFCVTAPGEGSVETILPRRNVLSRQAGHGRRAKRHVYCANVDIVVVVCAAQEPPFRPALVDRLLITACCEELTPVVCLNKIDLDPAGEAVCTMEVYRQVGYEVFLTSAQTGEGVDALAQRLTGASSVFSGHSGVGKTSLLTWMIPGFSRRTRETSKRARGRHATTEVQLVRLPRGGYVVDTPGFREFTVWGVAPEDIGSHYPEFLPHAANCRFHNCLHHTDPGCAVRKAVEEGEITALRYRNYLRILEAHGGG